MIKYSSTIQASLPLFTQIYAPDSGEEVCEYAFLSKVHGCGEAAIFMGATFMDAATATLVETDGVPMLLSLQRILKRLNQKVNAASPLAADISVVKLKLSTFVDANLEHFAAHIGDTKVDVELSLTARLARPVKEQKGVMLPFGFCYNPEACFCNGYRL